MRRANEPAYLRALIAEAKREAVAAFLASPEAAEGLARALHNMANREAVGVVITDETDDSGLRTKVRACEASDHEGHAAAILAAWREQS